MTTYPRSAKHGKNGRFLSASDIADSCEVATAAVLKCVGSGRLPSSIIAGGQYRVQRSDLGHFLVRHGMVVGEGSIDKDHTRKRILIVDDEAAVVSFIEGALSLEGEYELSSAFDGFEAGHQLAIFEPDLIVLDIMLPGMDGFEICRRVKSDPRTSHVKVLAVTGFATEENIEKILQYGADDYLAKPLKLEELKSKVHELLSSGS